MKTRRLVMFLNMLLILAYFSKTALAAVEQYDTINPLNLTIGYWNDNNGKNRA